MLDDAENRPPQPLDGDQTVSIIRSLKNRTKSHAMSFEDEAGPKAARVQGATTPLRGLREMGDDRTPLEPINASLNQNLQRIEAECQGLPAEQRYERLSQEYGGATAQLGTERTAQASQIWLRYAQLQA